MSGLPPRNILIRFLAERHPVSIREAATVLGFREAAVRRRADREGCLLRHDMVPWSEVAYWLVTAWPATTLVHRLGHAAALLPAGLHPRRVSWRLPAYLVTALERQTAIEARRRDDVHSLSIEQYASEQLHVVIDDRTVAELQEDLEFIQAFYFPLDE